MEFIDHTGHVFSMPFYSKYPIGYEYETNPYIFWLDSEYTNNLSINTYYIKPIYALFNESDNFNMYEIKITVDSKIYKLVGSKQIQDLLEKNKSYKENIELEENTDLKDELYYTENKYSSRENDLNILKIKKAICYRGYKQYNVNTDVENITLYKDIITEEEYKENEFNNFNTESRIILNLNNNYYTIFFDKNYIDDYQKIQYKGSEYRAYYWVKNDENIFEREIISSFFWNLYLSENRINEMLCISIGYQNGIQIFHPIEIIERTLSIDYIIKNNKKTEIDSESENIEIKNNNKIYIEEIEHYISEEELQDIISNSNGEYEFIYNTIYKDFILIPFYVIGNASEEGTWLSNVLINVSSKAGIEYKEEHYTHITVGGVYRDNIEELVINGKNMGVYLPKDILRAIYHNSFYSDTVNEELYNEKIKEYLMNFMVIRGEQGNFNSVKASLEWFGWGDKLEISKLLQNDNLVFNQYIRDYFNIKYDLIEAYKLFRNSTYISLSLKENIENGENKFSFPNEDWQDENKFWGEAKPKLESLFDKTIYEVYDEDKDKDENDETIIKFYKSYYDFVFNEIGLKITALKYYYQKYFLPIHLHIKTASIEHKVYLNDIKHITAAHYIYNERPCMIQDNDVYVEFPKNKIHTLEEISDIVDENYNKFNNTELRAKNDIIDAYSFNNMGVKIPIKFNYKSNILKEKTEDNPKYKTEYFDCILIVKVNDKVMFDSHFNFTQTFKNKNTYYNYFLLCPKYLTKSEYDITYWINNTISICLFVNGKFFNYSFYLKEPVLNLELGKLEYQYYVDNKDLAPYDDFNKVTPFDQLSKFFSFKSFMWDDYKDDNLLTDKPSGNIVLLNDIDYNKKILNYKNDFEDNRFNEYYIEEDLLNKKEYIEEELLNNNQITEKEIMNISERKSFKLNNPLSDTIKYLYFYDGENIYKKYIRVYIIFGQEIKNTDIILNIENIFEYDPVFDDIYEQDFFTLKSYNYYFFEIRNKVVNGDKIKISPRELFNLIDIYYKTETNFVKVNDINEITEDNKYFIKLDNETLNYYYYYDDLIDDTIIKKDINEIDKSLLYKAVEQNLYNLTNEDSISNEDIYYIKFDNLSYYFTYENILGLKINDISFSKIDDKSFLYKINNNHLIQLEKNDILDENETYYLRFDRLKYLVYNKVVRKFYKRENNTIYNYYYQDTVNGYYDYMDDYEYSYYDFEDNIEKYIYIRDFNLYTKENKAWYNLLKTSYIKTNVVNDSKFLNRVILFDLYKENEIDIYRYNKYESLANLYEKFFYTEDIYEYYLYGELTDKENIKYLDRAEQDSEDYKVIYVPIDFNDLDESNKYKYWYKNDNGNFINLIQNDELSESRNYYIKVGKLLKYKKGSSKIILHEDYPYDMYLMHDDIQWFCIFISRKTIGENYFNNDKFYPKEKTIKISDVILKYVKGSNRFLINRYKFKYTEGYNHFKIDDIIVCTLSDNKNISFKQDLSSKWQIIPKSIGISDNSNVIANTNTLIFSVGKDNMYYEKGYYTVKIRYSIDDYIQHQKEKSCIIKIE